MTVCAVKLSLSLSLSAETVVVSFYTLCTVHMWGFSKLHKTLALKYIII